MSHDASLEEQLEHSNGGLLLDTLAYQFLGSWEYKDESYVYYDWMCRDFFSYMEAQDTNKTYWLAPGSGQRVYRGDIFQYKAGRCRKIAVEAVQHESAKENWSAKKKWRQIFGSSFPS